MKIVLKSLLNLFKVVFIDYITNGFMSGLGTPKVDLGFMGISKRYPVVA